GERSPASSISLQIEIIDQLNVSSFQFLFDCEAQKRIQILHGFSHLLCQVSPFRIKSGMKIHLVRSFLEMRKHIKEIGFTHLTALQIHIHPIAENEAILLQNSLHSASKQAE